MIARCFKSAESEELSVELDALSMESEEDSVDFRFRQSFESFMFGIDTVTVWDQRWLAEEK